MIPTLTRPALLAARTAAQRAWGHYPARPILSAARTCAHALDSDEAEDALDALKEAVGHLEGLMGVLIEASEQHCRAVRHQAAVAAEEGE